MKMAVAFLSFCFLLGCSGESSEKDASTDPVTQEFLEYSGTTASSGYGKSTQEAGKLLWPIDCTLGHDCTIQHADIDEDGVSFNCGDPGYVGHQGTDISLMSWSQMDSGVDVYAADSGVVLWAFDHPEASDRCTENSIVEECLSPNSDLFPGMDNGYAVCTEAGNYCSVNDDESLCFWCFYGKNVVVIEHPGGEIFATRYDHLKSGSVLVQAGDIVERGEKIAEVGSAGKSTGPHLHFEIWGDDYYDLQEPFAGDCGPNFSGSLL